VVRHAASADFGDAIMCVQQESRNLQSFPIRSSADKEQSEMLHRIHVLVDYSYYHDAPRVFFVIQNMDFVREAE
jgi:hypothetical protein